jgi:dihydrofolate reductase
MTLIISLIAAMTRNRVIGEANTMPWHLPADLKHFKQVTMAKPIIMGRKTFESIGRPLPGRNNIVVTRDKGFTGNSIKVVAGIEQAIYAAGPVDEVMVIGGAQIYRQFLTRADRLYLTLIDTEVSGDAFFPDINPDEWRLTDSSCYAADDENPFNLQFVNYVRR